MVAPPCVLGKGWLLVTGSALLKKIRDTHANPVKRRLVRTPEQWSSAREYILGEAGSVRLNERQTVELKRSDPKSKTTPKPVWEAEPRVPTLRKARRVAQPMAGSGSDKGWASPRYGDFSPIAVSKVANSEQS